MNRAVAQLKKSFFATRTPQARERVFGYRASGANEGGLPLATGQPSHPGGPVIFIKAVDEANVNRGVRTVIKGLYTAQGKSVKGRPSLTPGGAQRRLRLRRVDGAWSRTSEG